MILALNMLGISTDALASGSSEMKKPGSASNSNAWATLSLPERIESSEEFRKSIVKVRKAFTGIEEHGDKEERFLNLMYYLLGWMVGDLGKNFSSKRPWARLQLDLCSKHPENLLLGSFVMNCMKMLGIPYTRLADRPPRQRHQHAEHRWQSYYSGVIAWLFTACLGLQRDELTSYDPIRMDWLLEASRARRLWFLRGLADSDGGVNISNKTVEITSEPNTEFIKALFDSLGTPVLSYASKGVETISMRATEAMKLRIFNPEIEGHKSRLLLKLAKARTFQRHWPEWLKEKVHRLIENGVDPSTIRNKLLFEDRTYVKLKTIKSKQRKVKNFEASGGNPVPFPAIRTLDPLLTRQLSLL